MGILGNTFEDVLDNKLKVISEINRIINLKINIIVIDPHGFLSYNDGYRIALDHAGSPNIKIADNFLDLSAGKFDFY